MVDISYSQAKLKSELRPILAASLYAIRNTNIPNSTARYVVTGTMVYCSFGGAFAEITYDKEVKKWVHIEVGGYRILLP